MIKFTAAANKREGHTHILLITTGSIASVKAPLIVEELLKVSTVYGHELAPQTFLLKRPTSALPYGPIHTPRLRHTANVSSILRV